jgi:hypothetical protein
MKLYGVWSESHKVLKDDWFLPSIKDDFEIHLEESPAHGSGTYQAPDWTEAVLHKSNTIVHAIEENMGDIFVYSDVDIQFFKPVKEHLLEAIRDKDIVCQKNDPANTLCTGFFVARCNEAVLNLWTRVRDLIPKERRDQGMFNQLVTENKNIRWGYLPDVFFGAGMGYLRPRSWLVNIGERLGALERDPQWVPGMPLKIPPGIVMHHANWTIGIERKVSQLKYVKNHVQDSTKALV